MKNFIIAFLAIALAMAGVLAFLGEPAYLGAVVAFWKVIWASMGDILLVLWGVVFALGKLGYALLPEVRIAIPALVAGAVAYKWQRRHPR
jgi:hypothetical protein